MLTANASGAVIYINSAAFQLGHAIGGGVQYIKDPKC